MQLVKPTMLVPPIRQLVHKRPRLPHAPAKRLKRPVTATVTKLIFAQGARVSHFSWICATQTPLRCCRH